MSAKQLSALRALLRCGRVPGHRPLRVLGSGTFGTVFKVRGRKAIKWVRRSFEEALERELRALVMVQAHDHFVRLDRVVPCWGEYLMVLELCDMDLRQYVIARRTLPEAQVRTLMEGLLSALEFIHLCGCIHRDIKPDNLLMKGHDTLKVADLGTMRFVDDDEDEDEGICCTIPFCAPEWLLGQADYDSGVDIWGAGLIMHFMRTGTCLTYWLSGSRIETLLRIFQYVGTPTEATWPGVTALPHFNAQWPRFARAARSARAVGDGMMLEPCPAKRWTAVEALAHLRRGHLALASS